MRKTVFIIIFSVFCLTLLYSFSIIRAERDFNVAVDLYDNKDYSSALFQFQNFIENYQGSELIVDAYYWAGESLYNLNRFEEAIEKYTHILNNFPNYRNVALVYTGLGHSYFSLRDFEQAIFYFETVKPLLIREVDIQVEIDYKIIEAYFFQRDYQNVIEHGKRFITAYPDRTDRIDHIRYRMGESALLLQNFSEGKTFLEPLKSREAGSFYSFAFFTLGRIYEQLDETENAKYIYNKIVQGDRNFRNISRVHFNLAYLYYAKEDFDNAIKNFSSVSSDVESIYKDSRYRIGQIYHLQRNYRQSNDSFKSFLNEIKDYNYNEANYLIARNYFLMRDLENSLRYIKNSFTQPDIEEKYVIMKLNVLYRLRKLDEVIIAYDKYKDLITSPTHQETMYYIFIKSLFNTERYDRAEIHYLAFLNRFRDSRFYYEIRKELAEIYFYTKKYSNAISVFTQLKNVERLRNFRDEITYYLALSYYNSGAIANAIREFREIYETYANSEYIEPSLIYLSQIYANRRNHGESRRWALKLINEYPQSKKFGVALYHRSIADYFIRDHEEAISGFSLIIDKYLSSLDREQVDRTHIFRGVTYYLIEEYEKSLPDLDFVINNSNFKNFVNDALLYRGLSNYRLNRFRIALEDLRNIDTNYLSDMFLSTHKYYLALAYYNLQNYEASYNITRTFNQIYNDQRITQDIDRLNYLNLFYSERYEEAESNILRLLKNTNHQYNLDNLFYITKISIELNKLESGLEYSNRLIRNRNYHRHHEALFDNGRILYLMNRYDDAIAVLNRAAATNDLNVRNRIYFIIGKCYEHKHQNIQAIHSFKKILEHKENNPLYEDALYNIANNYFKYSDYRQSIDFFNRLYREFPESKYIPENFLMTGQSFFNLNFYEQSIEEFKKVLKYRNDPLVETAIYSIAVSYFNIENYNQAIVYYTRLRNEFPDSQEAANSKYGIGLSYKKMGNEPEFIKHYEELIKQYPERSLAPAALFELGQYFYDNENFREAVVYYKKLIDNYQEFSLINNVIYNLGTSQYALDEYEEAKKTFEQLVGLDGDESEMSFYFLGNIMFLSNNYSSAIEYYKQVKDKSLLNEVYFKKGISYYYTENYVESLNFLKEVNVTQLSSENRNSVTFFIGDSLLKIRETERAIEKFLSLIETNVKADYMDYVTEVVFRHYLETGSLNNAVKYMEVYIQNFPNADNIHDIIYLCAETAFKSNNLIVAENYFSQIVNNNIEKYLQDAFVSLADIYLKRNDNKSYIVTVERMIDNNMHELSDLIKLLDIYYNENLFDKYILLNERIIKEHSRNIEALNSHKRLAEIYKKLNNNEKAIDYYQLYLDKLPRERVREGAEVQFQIGLVYFENKRFQEAIVEFWKVRFYKTSDVADYNFMDKAYYYIIKSYIEIDDMHNARIQFRNFRNEMPESDFIKKLENIL